MVGYSFICREATQDISQTRSVWLTSQMGFVLKGRWTFNARLRATVPSGRNSFRSRYQGLCPWLIS